MPDIETLVDLVAAFEEYLQDNSRSERRRQACLAAIQRVKADRPHLFPREKAQKSAKNLT